MFFNEHNLALLLLKGDIVIFHMTPCEKKANVESPDAVLACLQENHD